MSAFVHNGMHLKSGNLFQSGIGRERRGEGEGEMKVEQRQMKVEQREMKVEQCRSAGVDSIGCV